MNNVDFLYKLGMKGFEKRRGYIPNNKIDEYIARFKLEHDLICSLHFEDYFLLVWDIVRWAREGGIMVAPGRGSVGGSLLSYLIEITSVDPIKHDLLFERFMNKERSSFDPPDVDLDFQASRRQEVKDYIVDKYGSDRVCSIGTHSVAYASNSIKDVAKVLGLNHQELNKAIARKLYDMTLQEGYDQVDSLKAWVDKDENNLKCFEIASKLEGMVRHLGVHAAGVIIAPKQLAGHVPTIQKDGVISTQWDMEHLQECGYLKVDILGLTTLDTISQTLESIPDDIDLLKLDLNDKKVLDLFSDGETTGIFQFEKPHLKKVMSQLSADNFEDLVVATTICRPASFDIGITDSYIKRKHGKEEISFPHSSLEELLQNTMGYPIYQESIMKMSNLGSGGELTTTDAEVIRDCIKHFRHDEIAKYKNRFIIGARKNLKASRGEASDMWNVIQASSGYTFNKSHAVAYSIIGYICGYLKKYYPMEFMAACLSQSDDDRFPSLLRECKKLRVEVNPVHINHSKQNFVVKNGKIYCGFSMIKSVGEVAADEIVNKQPFRSREDFEDKVEKRKCNIRVKKKLEEAGAFGEVGDYGEYLKIYGGMAMGELPDWDFGELPSCTKCELYKNRRRVVCGSGSMTAQVMFVGEAPGFTEDERGKPFVGQAGRLLRRQWIPVLGIGVKDVYITNIVKCLPPVKNNRVGKPTEEEQNVCSVWLEKEIAMVKPKIVVAVGGFALKMLSREMSIMKTHGETFEVITPHNVHENITGFALIHPAYTLRNPEFQVDEALISLKKLLHLEK